MTLYSTGMRRAELCHLRIEDIDNARMVIHIREGKGGKDRDVALSPKLLEELRPYRRLGRKPGWLFPGRRCHTADQPMTDKVVWHACREAANGGTSQTGSSAHAPPGFGILHHLSEFVHSKDNWP